MQRYISIIVIGLLIGSIISCSMQPEGKALDGQIMEEQGAIQNQKGNNKDDGPFIRPGGDLAPTGLGFEEEQELMRRQRIARIGNAIRSIAALGDEDEVSRQNAFDELIMMKDAVPGLILALDDEEGTIRKEAATALGLVGPDAAEALPKLRELAGSDPWLESAAENPDGYYPVREAAKEAVVEIERLLAEVG